MLRAKLEAAVAVLLGLMAIGTLLVPDWIEVFTGADPDMGDGAVEWAIVIGLAVLAIASSLMAHRDHVRARRSRAHPQP